MKLVPHNHLTTIFENGNYSQTYTTYACVLLETAETLIGKRTSEYVYTGIEFSDLAPRTRYYPLQSKYITIHLTPDTLTDFTKGIFQLSHEVVHLISPNGKDSTNVLEEGMATYFSRLMTEKITGDSSYSLQSIAGTSYFDAMKYVESLLSIQADAIMKLREFEPVMYNINREHFLRAKINASDELISSLVAPMNYPKR